MTLEAGTTSRDLVPFTDEYTVKRDNTLAQILTSVEGFAVSYAADVVYKDDTHVEIRRTVTKRAHRAKDRNTVWTEVVAVLDVMQAAELMKDLAIALADSKSA